MKSKIQNVVRSGLTAPCRVPFEFMPFSIAPVFITQVPIVKLTKDKHKKETIGMNEIDKKLWCESPIRAPPGTLYRIIQRAARRWAGAAGGPLLERMVEL
jgi:hypothetical protein